MEHQLSDEARIIVHDDGSAELMKSLPIDMNGVLVRLPLTVDEVGQLHRFMLFEDVPGDALTCCAAFEPDDEDLIECPACHKMAKKNFLLKSPVGEIFCHVCRKNECQHCQRPKEECIGVKGIENEQ